MTDSEEILKQRLMQFARERFLIEGFARVSVDDLSGGLAISKKTFYKVFTSKEDLVDQLVGRTLGELMTRLDSIVDSNGSFVRKINDLMQLLGNVIGTRMSKIFAQDIQRHLPHIWKKIEDFRRERVFAAFARLTQQGIAEGHIRPDVNIKIFLMSYLGAIDRVMNPAVLMDEPVSAADAINAIMRIFFLGIMTDDARHEFKKLQTV